MAQTHEGPANNSSSYGQWRAWIATEELRRLAFAHIHLACFAVVALRTPAAALPMNLLRSIFHIPALAPEHVWAASSSAAWRSMRTCRPSSLANVVTAHRTEMWRAVDAIEAFLKGTAHLALDARAGVEIKMRRRALAQDSRRTVHEDALWTLVELQDQSVNCRDQHIPGSPRSTSDTTAYLIRQLGCISLQIPLHLLRSFARASERSEDSTREQIRLCVMKDGSSRGRRMLLAGAKAWAVLADMSRTDMDECSITPYALFFATCAIYLYAYMLRLATQATTTGDAESPDYIPLDAENLYID